LLSKSVLPLKKLDIDWNTKALWPFTLDEGPWDSLECLAAGGKMTKENQLELE
jgi:hypothetical protein